MRRGSRGAIVHVASFVFGQPCLKCLAEKFYLRLILKRFVPFCNSSNTPREKFYPLLNAILADNDLLCSVFTPVLFGVHNPGKSDACTRCPRARPERGNGAVLRAESADALTDFMTALTSLIFPQGE